MVYCLTEAAAARLHIGTLLIITKTWVRPGATAPSDYHYIGENNVNGGSWYGKDRSFDQEIMNQLGDHNARYYDGALGGVASIAGLPHNPLSSGDRYDAGKRQGASDAQTIIDNLARDKNGNITETIKIITHSMGGVYGSGYLAALKEYIKDIA